MLSSSSKRLHLSVLVSTSAQIPFPSRRKLRPTGNQAFVAQVLGVDEEFLLYRPRYRAKLFLGFVVVLKLMGQIFRVVTC